MSLSDQTSPRPWSYKKSGRIEDYDGEIVAVTTSRSDDVAEANAMFIHQSVVARDILDEDIRSALTDIKVAVDHLYSVQTGPVPALPPQLHPYAGPIGIIERSVSQALVTLHALELQK